MFGRKTGCFAPQSPKTSNNIRAVPCSKTPGHLTKRVADRITIIDGNLPADSYSKE
jgi:hypothetical protein